MNGPGLGKPVVQALQIQNVGAAFVAGLAIVMMAIMLDRTTTAASERTTGRTNVGSASGPGVMLTGVVLERLPRWATEEAGRVSACRDSPLRAGGCSTGCSSSRSSRWSTCHASARLREFPDVTRTPVLKWISGLELTRINDFTDWVIDKFGTFTLESRTTSPTGCINPLQDLIAESPWWLMALVLLAVAYVLGRLAPGRDHGGLRGGSSSSPGSGTTR